VGDKVYKTGVLQFLAERPFLAEPP
jgi:hypothetical protein